MFTRLLKDYGLEDFDTERSKGTFTYEVQRTLKIDMGQAGKYRLRSRASAQSSAVAAL